MSAGTRALLGGILLFAAGCGADGVDRAADADAANGVSAQQDQVLGVAEDDAEMNAAIAKAQATLDPFLALAEQQPEGTSDYKLKVEVTDANGSEHFWVAPFERTSTGFRGVLANEPQLVQSVKYGETFDFRREQVSDWGYVKNGRQFGSFTVCVMMKRIPAEEAASFSKEHGFDC